MKQKHLKHLFTALLMLCATVATAHDFVVGGIYYNILSEEEKTVEVTCSGTYSSSVADEYTGKVVIPESVVYNNVTYSVTSIGYDGAFAGCTGLTSVVIPNSVTSIGYRAFYGCTGLTSVEIPNSVTSIGNSAFENCTGLTSIEIPNSVTSIGGYVFQNCTSLISAVIGDGVTNIGALFVGCTSLISIEIPNSVTSIGMYTFKYCRGLTSIKIPNGVTSIGDEVFCGCSGLTSIEIPNSVTSIGYSAFSGCSGLTSIEIPNSVTSIGNNAFKYCSGLTSIEIPNGVTSIGDGAFEDCYNLRIVYNNSSLDITAGSSDYGYIGYYADAVVNKNDNFEKVGDFTFHKTGSTVTLLDYTGVDNVISLPASYNGQNYAIARRLFYNKSNITSVTIPYGVTSIGEEAFYGCTGLTSIEIPNSVTSIGNGAFQFCTSLTSIEIPNSVTSIGNGAFQFCTSLTSIVIPNGVESIGDNMFEACRSLTSIVIPNGVTSFGVSTFAGCSSLTSIEIPNSVTNIGVQTFAFCSSLTTIEIPNSVTSIGGNMFADCTGLTSIEIPNSITSIGEGAFCFCTGLTSVVIGNSVTSIGGSAFFGCSGLTSVEIPNSVTSIGGEAFYGCSGLKSITSLIPAENLFAIGGSQFGNVDKNTCTLYVPYGAKETYASTEGWEYFENIVEIIPTEITITINRYGCATFCSDLALDFSEVEGLKAYSAIGFKPSTQVVTLARVMTTGAGQGVFIKGEPGEYIVPVIDDFDEYTLNMLVGTLEQTVVNSTEGEMSNYKFTILPGDETPMFYPFEDNTTFSAGKAYLQIPTAWLPATAQKSLSIRFDDGETTGIDELKGESGEGKTIYDLQGRVIENPTSGIYIINGKKTLVK